MFSRITNEPQRWEGREHHIPAWEVVFKKVIRYLSSKFLLWVSMLTFQTGECHSICLCIDITISWKNHQYIFNVSWRSPYKLIFLSSQRHLLMLTSTSEWPKINIWHLQVRPSECAEMAAVGGRGGGPVAASDLRGQADPGADRPGLAAGPRRPEVRRPRPSLRRGQRLPRVCQAHCGEQPAVQVGDWEIVRSSR